MKLFIGLCIALFALPFASADMGASTGTYDTTPPALGVSVAVPADVQARHVFGTVYVQASAINPADLRLEVQDGCTGAFVLVQIFEVNAAGGLLRYSYSATFLASDCYRFRNVADPSVANSIRTYSFVDWKAESFEGRAHANATRIEMNATRTAQNDAQNTTRTEQNDIQNATLESQAHANATWEGQVHANATWCPLTGSGCFVPIDVDGNFTGNFTGNFSGSFNNTNATGNFSGDFNNTNATGNFTGNFTDGSYNGTLSGNFTQTFSVTQASDSLDVSLSWALASLALWVIIGYFSVERGVWLVAVAPAGELFNIALSGAGASRMWGEQFSVLLLVAGGTLHILFFVIPRIWGKNEPSIKERDR